MLRTFTFRALLTAAYFAVVIGLGTAGYMWIEGWEFGDAIYMTIITITAVGYEEVSPLTADGRIFTGLLLALGMTGLGIWFALVTAFLVELDLRDTYIRRRMDKSIAGLRDHYLLCGAGRTGHRVAEALATSKEDFVIIERDPERVAKLIDAHPDIPIIEGDATEDGMLKRAGIEAARGLVTTLSEDADNLYVCLSARALRPDLNIVSRANADESADKLRLAGADHVVSPIVSGALQMSAFLTQPGVESFLDVVTRSPEIFLRMEVTSIDSGSRLDGESLRTARVREKTGLVVIAVKKGGVELDGGYVFNPPADTRLEPGDELVVLGAHEQVEKLRTYATV